MPALYFEPGAASFGGERQPIMPPPPTLVEQSAVGVPDVAAHNFEARSPGPRLEARSGSTPYYRNLPMVTALRSIDLLWLRVHSFYVAMRRPSRQ